MANYDKEISNKFINEIIIENKNEIKRNTNILNK